MSSNPLNVIALISGGKDSFFSILHCVHNGHRVVALANLFPSGEGGSSPAVQFIDPAEQLPTGQAENNGEATEKDLNSFMYQTVGHEVIPLYAAATGLPLYRQPILGGAVRHERDYDHAASDPETGEETESMIPLLQTIKARHPDANALCAGAILSTYQRTRVESIALRLGLVPLAYLWKYPILPPPSLPADDAQLLNDMAAAGLEARIIKVASAGLDERHLWERVSSETGADRVKGALRKFGAAEGAALGEGGEFETLVLDGPASLFQKKIIIPEKGRSVVQEGGGTTWLMLRGAHLEEKPAGDDRVANIRTPDLLDSTFQTILDSVLSSAASQNKEQRLAGSSTSKILQKASNRSSRSVELLHWSVLAEPSNGTSSIESETLQVVDKIRHLISSSSIDASQITNTVIVLRDMSDFPKVNSEYGKLFVKPNPPSRVTISCGDLLPAGCNIAVHLTAPARQVKPERQGLHVQSQSYWAPANIGPYSQAIDVPVTSQHEPTGLRSVSVAGQIPLIPASMTLPPPSSTSLEQQIVISLQHLWRIGLEMKVQCWTSAVAYFARSSSVSDMKRNAQIAGRAWGLIHAPPEEEDDAENDTDPWDLKYNPEYMSLGGSEQKNVKAVLPDWSIFTLQQQNEPECCIPPFFVAEVEGLPRQSAVEWHAHNGLSHVGESSSEIIHLPEIGVAGWRASHMVARASGAIFLHTVLSCDLAEVAEVRTFEALSQAMDTAHQVSLKRLKLEASEHLFEAPYLAYIDAVTASPPWSGGKDHNEWLPFALIPCRSLWSLKGERLGFVGLFKTIIHTIAS